MRNLSVDKKKQREYEKLIGWIVKPKEKIKDNDYNIKPNEEYEVIKVVDGKIVLNDVGSNEYYVDLDYIRKNFELVCELS